jgi:hypothetical protein
MTETPSGPLGDEAVDLAGVLGTVDQPWQPLTVATLNDYDVRVVRTAGEFTRHAHPETDELFLVPSGSLTIVVERPDGRPPSAARCEGGGGLQQGGQLGREALVVRGRVVGVGAHSDVATAVEERDRDLDG